MRLTAAQKLDALTDLGIELSRISDLDILMERILGAARQFTNSDAGSIYIKNQDQLLFSYTQNDTLEKRLPSGHKLIYSTCSVPVDENSLAGFVGLTGETLSIPDVYNIVPSQPYHFSHRFDDFSGYRTKSVLTVPLITYRQEVVGVLQIINSLDQSGSPVAFQPEDVKFMSHFASTATVALDRAQMTRAIIIRMIRMAELRDPQETGAHVNRVGAYAVEIYERWAGKKGVTAGEINIKRDILRTAAMLHDVGKVAVPDVVLKKPGPFTTEEFELMKFHTIHGARLFRDRHSEFDDAALEVALTHHERWDGQGYPGHVDLGVAPAFDGWTGRSSPARVKSGLDIPLFGRIVAIADVFDALCSKRVYKPAWPEEQALAAIRGGSGSQFDPELVAAFFESLSAIRAIKERYPEEETGIDHKRVVNPTF